MPEDNDISGHYLVVSSYYSYEAVLDKIKQIPEILIVHELPNLSIIAVANVTEYLLKHLGTIPGVEVIEPDALLWL